MDRRTFLKYSISASVIWLGWDIPGKLGMSSAQARTLFDTEGAQPSLAFFPHSVAAGDPQPHGAVLWTRVAPQMLSGAQRTSKKIKLAFEIARDPGFRKPVLRGVTETYAERDFTVKVQVDAKSHLQPFHTYYYRFIYQGVVSPTGRFKTLPMPGAHVDRVRFGFISCQDYGNGYYTALAALAEEDIDFVVHLGDYIYETVADPSFQNAQVRPLTLPSGAARAETLDDYRHLYRTYKTDADLQRVHERFAFISMWDDHEFANDAYREFTTDSADEAANRTPARRQAASQAWAEYTAAGVAFDGARPPTEALRLYRSFAIGDLMELVMTDQRLYRDGPPCGLQEPQRYLTPGCANRLDPRRTMLGGPQRAWFLDTMQNSPRTWKIWGNEVMLMQLKIGKAYTPQLFPGAPPVDLFFTLDQWDGYPAERALLLSELRRTGVKNLIAITGDIHSYFAGYLKTDFDNLFEAPAGVEFVCGSISSSNFIELATAGAGGLPALPPADLTAVVRASNPHMQFFDSFRHGYNLLELTPEAALCTLRAVSTVRQPQAVAYTLKAFRVRRDQPHIEEVQAPTAYPIAI